jgi:5-methylcytosine-specific restriction endonuclease McrA
MKVYAINKHGRPLMPTTPRKARLLLKEGKAKIVGRDPFTIQLIYGSSGYVQPGTLGVDAGYANIGYSAVNEKEELIGGEVKMLQEMSERLTERAKYRRQRRNRKRYRAPRFDNRRRKDGWLAPSIQHKLDTHHKIIDRIKSIVPVNKVVIEVASFDIQKIKNAEIEGVSYQQGEQYGFDNLREYILHRDRHKCQNPDCKNKSTSPILQVHHVGFWKEDRTDRPANLITLCDKCHTPKNHKKTGFLFGWQPKLKSFKGETFMSTVRWRLIIEGEYSSTYGYITKGLRRDFNIELNIASENTRYEVEKFWNYITPDPLTPDYRYKDVLSTDTPIVQFVSRSSIPIDYVLNRLQEITVMRVLQLLGRPDIIDRYTKLY